MRFREELVPVSEYDFPKAKVRDAEMRMARQLIDAYAAEWDPDKYTDEYRANLMAIIEARRKRQKPELERQEPETSAEVVDLMERLRQSLERGKRGAGAKRAKPRTTRRKTARKRAA
jgi:DNA end-binding protein Ku